MPFRDEAYERRGPAAPIEVDMASNSTSQFYADLGGSVVGVFASTFIVLERDVHVEVVITFSDGSSFRTTGLVQFIREAGPDQLPGLGIAFSELRPEDRALIESFTRIYPPMFYDE